LNDNVNEEEMGNACSMHGENRNVCKILVRKPKGKRSLGRSRSRWEYNIKKDLREV
jgi:hypothetical protein